MESLIPIQKTPGGRDVVSAQVLHCFLEVNTRFDTWFGRRIEEFSFLQGVDFQGPILSATESADYVITLDMAKELSMVERNEQGRIARRYFIACEKQLRGLAEAPRPMLPTNFKEALTALLAEVEQKEALEQQLALAAPALAFTAAFSESKDLLSVAELAKTLNIPNVGRTILFRWLRRDGYLQDNNQPYQRHINSGLFVVKQRVLKQRSEENNLQAQTMVTGKGAKELAKRYKPEPAAELS